MLLGQVAWAKSIIVEPFNNWVDGNGINAYFIEQRNLFLVTSMIARTGGQFSVTRTDKTKTEWIRTGRQAWNMGNTTPAAPSPGAYVEQFDAWIDLGGSNGNSVASPPVGSARPDSLYRVATHGGTNRSASVADVPGMVFAENSLLLGAPSNDQFSVSAATADSLSGCQSRAAGPGPAVFMAGGLPYLTHAYTAGAIGVGTGHAAGIRRILYGAIGQYMDHGSFAATSGGSTITKSCSQCDSVPSTAANDSTILWDKQFQTLGPSFTNAKPVSFCMAWGGGAAQDSLSTFAGGPPTEGDFPTILAALAHLDSLSGHKVLGDKIIRIAPVVYGGLSRGPRHAWNWNKTQGIFAPDTAAFYACLDSLAALGIPVTFAVNVDSATAYARDVVKLKQYPQFHFTPQVWDAVDDSSTASLATFPQDIFGRWRKRAAFGDSMNHSLYSGGADSSIAWQLKRALAMCDSIFQRPSSRVLAAPADDWSPKQITGADAGGTGIDSVFYAMQLAGFTGVVADAQDPDANASKTGSGPSKTNPRGYYNVQSYFNSAKIPAVRNFKILTHSGFSVMGGRAQYITFTDSTAAAADGSPGLLYIEIARLWSAALLDFDNSYDTWPYDNTGVSPTHVHAYSDIQQRKVDWTQAQGINGGRPVRHGNIYRLDCADLSGLPSGPPALNGYWTLRSAKRAMDVINKLAGRTVVMFDYPDNVTP
jgi:hypothetical protein